MTSQCDAGHACRNQPPIEHPVFPWFRFMFYRPLRADLVSLPGAIAGIDSSIVCLSLANVQGDSEPYTTFKSTGETSGNTLAT
jgi:hypothetical protein